MLEEYHEIRSRKFAFLKKTMFGCRPKIRLARQLPSLTLLYSVFPIAEHGDLDDVPELTAVQVLHFSPK